MSTLGCKVRQVSFFRVGRYCCNAALALFLLMVAWVFGLAIISESLTHLGIEISSHLTFTPILLGFIVLDSDSLILLYFSCIALLLALSFFFLLYWRI